MPAPEGKRLPASFSDVTTDATTFVSNWRSTKNVMDAETSTEPIKVSGRRTQHPEMAEQSMQTGEAATAAPGAGFAHSQLLDAFLLEHNERKGRDDTWSDDADGEGQNWLGLLLMLLVLHLLQAIFV